MEENSRFDFCPKCGAVARDGICQSCGYQNTDAMRQAAAQPYAQAAPQYRQAQACPPQSVQAPYGAGAGYPPQSVQLPYGAGAVPPQSVQAPYGAGAGYRPQVYQPYASVPPATPKKSKAAAIIYFISLVIVLASVVFLILAAVNDMENRNSEKGGRSGRTELEQEKTHGTDGEDEQEENEKQRESITYYYHSADVTEQNWNEAGQDTSLPYYSGPYNALRDDLSYALSFKEETYGSDDVAVFLVVEYPQIVSGNVTNAEYINRALNYDYDYFHNLFMEEFKPVMSDGDVFHVEVDSHVTYMDEKILSVVFVEKVYLNLENDPFSMINYFCMNFDLETGVLLEDTELFRLDEAFAVDFRRREAEENGEGALTGYSDQEILDMLKDASYLVVFYTPMGMEVGLNLGNRVVYVTYEDYERFLNTF